MSFLDQLKKPWVKVLTGGLVWAATLLVAFAFGKYMTPPQVIETQKVVVQEKEVLKVVEVEKKIIERVVDTTESKRIHKERTEETKPDGSKLVKETTDIGVDRTIKDVEVKFVDRTNTIERVVEVEKLVEVERRVEAHKPNWEVGVKFGTVFTEFSKELKSPYTNLMVVGVDVERRIAGPVKMGLWVDSNLAFDHVSGGLSASIEF